MQTEKSQGFLIFAQNNSTVDYLKIALTNALLIQKYLNKPVSVVTDSLTLKWPYHVENAQLLEDTFDQIIIQEKNSSFVNQRAYRDTIYHSVQDNFNNSTRASAYELSPYDETILIDADYLVFDDVLNGVWGSSEDILLNSEAIDLNGVPLTGAEQRISDTGIRMYWATCIYFKKCERAKMLFSTTEHVRKHWDFYQLTYDFQGHLFRNDFAFSIAIHLMNDFEEANHFKSLPNPQLLTVLDSDQAFSYDGDGVMTLFVHNKVENWKFEITKIKKMSVHLLNKLSLMPLLDSIIEDAQL